MEFHQHKNPILINNIDVNKTVVSKKVLFRKKGFKYFIGYKDAKKIRPLFMFIPKMSAYRRCSGETKYMSFLMKDDESLEKYEIWEKVRNSIKNEFETGFAYNEKYLRTKMKSSKGKIITNFHSNKVSKEGSQFLCLSVILIDSVYRKDRNYYLEVFLEEVK